MARHLLILFLALAAPLHAQNRVLELDGDGDFVELPRGIFNHLTEATVEGWVRFDEFRFWAPFISFGKAKSSLGFNHRRHTATLQFFISRNRLAGTDLIRIHEGLQPEQWVHLAGVTGPGGMALYINGTLAGQRDYTGSFADIDSSGHRNYLGRPHLARNAHMRGALDEVRVWGVARTGAQIRDAMFRPLRGDEAGLIGLWNFDAGDARDSAPNGHHGQLFGDARTVERPFFAPDEVVAPAAINGAVYDSEGLPLRGARVHARQRGETGQAVGTNAAGQYRLAVYARDSLDVHAEWQGMRLDPGRVRVAAGEERRLDWRVLPRAAISGRIWTLGAAPQQGVVVQLVRAERGASAQVARSALSVGDGRYRFEQVPAGRYQVRAYRPGEYVYYAGGDTIQVGQEGERQDIDMRLPTVKRTAWKSYDYIDGLDATVSALYQDDDHVLWVGTAQGIYHFDGADFTHRGNDFLQLEQWDALSKGTIRHFVRDRAGRLWFATSEAGIVGFDGERFWRLSKEQGLLDDRVTALLVDREDNLWIGARDGLTRYDGEQFTYFTEADGLAGSWVNDLLEDRQGRLWVAGPEGISSYDGEAFTLFDIAPALAQGRLAGRHKADNELVQSIAEDRFGHLWFGIKGGALRYDGREIEVITPIDGLVGDDIRDIHLDRNGHLWFTAYLAGVSRYDGLGFVNYTLADGLADSRVTNLYETADGALWVGFFREEQGFGMSTLPADHLRHYDSRDGLIGRGVYGFAQLKSGDVLLRMRQGLMRYDGKAFTPYEPVPGLAQQTITCVYEEGDTLYFATDGAGAWRYDGRYARRLTADDGLASNYVRDVLRTADGALYFATLEGLTRYDGRSFRSYTRADGLPSEDLVDLHLDARGRLWLATARGVAWCDVKDAPPERGGFRLLHKRGSVQMQGIYPGLEGDLYFASRKGFGHYTHTDLQWVARIKGRRRGNISNRNVEAIRQSPDSILWVATQRGLNLFDGTAWSVLDAKDGLPDEIIYDIHFGAEGDTWLATGAGLTRYRRSRLRPRAHVERVVADRVYERWAAIAPIEVGTPVTIEVGTSLFHAPLAKCQYRYRMAAAGRVAPSADRAWTAPTRNRHFEWVPQEPGTYFFEAQVIDRDLNYSEPLQLALEVVVPWQHNAWIVAPLVGGVLGMIGWTLFASARYYQQRREAAHLREALLVEERRARGAAEAANSAKSLFLANMSHEIRTPMNAVLGYARMLENDQDLPESLRHRVRTIGRSGRFLLGLINDVLDIARIEAGQAEVNEVAFDLHLVLQGMADTFRPRCIDKGLDWLERGWPQERLWVQGDEAKLSQVLMNLLSNAVKFTQEGQVELAVEERDGDIYHFTVTDSGPGFDAGDAEVLFEPFQQGEAGRREGGTGLGLAIARRNVELLGGKLWWESTPNRGSKLGFTVCLLSIMPPESASDRETLYLLAPGRKYSALIVDDVEENREVLEQLLQQMGCITQTAASGVEAMEQVDDFQPDIIFMDIRMADMDGIETAKRIWQQYGRESIKIVSVSASVLAHQRQQYRAVGFDFVLEKPIESDQVVECLRQVLGAEFAVAEVEAAEPVLAPIELPNDLVDQLRTAAEYYNISDLERLIEVVKEQDAVGRQWATRMNELVDQYDMPGLLALLGKIRP